MAATSQGPATRSYGERRLVWAEIDDGFKADFKSSVCSDHSYEAEINGKRMIGPVKCTDKKKECVLRSPIRTIKLL